ncbi:MAG: 2-amino-4-hydroxy-6-hydroxymethyldihydropteridine diphosphokinase [Acidimicrobiia bacterium]|nr:2-amino-4-hydroxy-6-hydroxymethyldihydropteridine diphosphokinase [Acidimicrobiia bacterium]
MTEAAIGLGSNLGDRMAYLDFGLEGIGRLGELVARSSVYETAPIGGPPQEPYLNMVVMLETSVAPGELLEEMASVEDAAGRVRPSPAAPRTLDLDLLLYGDLVVDEPGLRVPHPRMLARRFVIEPLLEVRPKAKLPDGTRISDYTEIVANQEVRPYEAAS